MGGGKGQGGTVSASGGRARTVPLSPFAPSLCAAPKRPTTPFPQTPNPQTPSPGRACPMSATAKILTAAPGPGTGAAVKLCSALQTPESASPTE